MKDYFYKKEEIIHSTNKLYRSSYNQWVLIIHENKKLLKGMLHSLPRPYPLNVVFMYKRSFMTQIDTWDLMNTVILLLKDCRIIRRRSDVMPSVLLGCGLEYGTYITSFEHYWGNDFNESV